MENGLFIVLEGGEGSGKTTVTKLLEIALNDLNYSVIITREPGGVKVAEEIRKVIMDNDLDYKTEALLFASARIEHLKNKIKPNLALNKIVISDRYIDSSVVYQGIARGLTIDKIFELNMWATNKFIPDLSFLLNIEPEEGLKRINQSNREVNRFDEETLEFHKQLNVGYQEVFKNRENSYIINANQTPEEITTEILTIILTTIGDK